MPIVVGVKFRGVGKVYYFAPGDTDDLSINDHVIVETARGTEIAVVTMAPREIAADKVVGQPKPVTRKASTTDLLNAERFRAKEDAVLLECREHVAKTSLPMKVVAAEYSYDGTRLTFAFTSEQRVDFRDLVRELAHHFNTRIELRQIGVRDEAKIVGGMGKCGRPLCCATWLSDFAPVSIRMAKQQDLPLSPMEISGLCGRLLCCLAYESDFYKEVKSKFPKVGKMIDTPVGPARLRRVRVFRETAEIELEDGTQLELTADQLAGKEPITLNQGNQGLNGLQQQALGQAISGDHEADLDEDDATPEQPARRSTETADSTSAGEQRRQDRRSRTPAGGGDTARRQQGSRSRRNQPARESGPSEQQQNGRAPEAPATPGTRTEGARSGSRRRRRSSRGGQQRQGSPTNKPGDNGNAQGSSGE